MARISWEQTLASGLAGLVGVFVILMAWPPQRNLLARSRRVVWLPSDPAGAISSPASYQWQSDRWVITDSFRDPGFVVEAYDVQAKAFASVNSLSSWVWLDDQWSKSFSPDGRWALASVSHAVMLPKPHGKWATEADSDIAADSTLVTLSDWQGGQKSLLTVFSGETSAAFWLSDSRHWAIILHTHNGLFLQIWDREQPKSVTLVPIQHGPLTGFVGETLGVGLGSQHQPEATSNGHISFINSDQGGDVALCPSIRGNRVPVQVEEAVLSLPVGSSLQAAAISPDGRQIAWILDFTDRQKIYPTSWERFREQYIEGQPPPDPQPYPSEEVWVSRSDGRRMREVGHLPRPDFSNQVSGLHWTPDGRRLSFIHKNYLYVTPADDSWHRQ